MKEQGKNKEEQRKEGKKSWMKGLDVNKLTKAA